MTNEQAIKRFETTLGGMKKQYETYSKTTKAFYNDMYRQKGTPTYEETFEMYDLAIRALKKQIGEPIKEHTEYLNDRSFYISECPACWKSLSKISNYCPECGQKLEVEVGD